MANITTHQRRYDLDWLRIIAFGLLIFYHIGMFYVTWGWHVKSVHAGPWFEPAMRLLNPWRLSLLFFISGVAIRFAIDKAKLGSFTWHRFWRLFLPLVLGIFIIVAPQSWLELVTKGETHKGFFDFYPNYIRGKFSIVTPTWNHLWYVTYILVYTLLIIPLARPLAGFMNGAGARMTALIFNGRIGVIFVMLLPFLPHMIYRIYLDPYHPTTHDLINDWANHAHSFTIFLMGFLVAKDTAFWKAVNRALLWASVLTLALALWLSIIWYDWNAYIEAGHNLWPARTGRVLFAWLAILTLLGLSQKFLKQPSKALTYMTEAIFPWYILHQTLIVIAGYWLTRQGLSVSFEFILLVAVTLSGCFLLHEFIIRRLKLLRPLFGLKLQSTDGPPNLY